MPGTKSDAHGNRHSNADAYRNSDTEGYSNSAAAPDCSASAVRLGSYTQLSSRTREAIREFPKSGGLFISERVKPI